MSQRSFRCRVPPQQAVDIRQRERAKKGECIFALQGMWFIHRKSMSLITSYWVSLPSKRRHSPWSNRSLSTLLARLRLVNESVIVIIGTPYYSLTLSFSTPKSLTHPTANKPNPLLFTFPPFLLLRLLQKHPYTKRVPSFPLPPPCRGSTPPLHRTRPLPGDQIDIQPTLPTCHAS